MGITDNPKDVLLSSSINLNTSLYEGFCLSILEAIVCGIPTITFNFGESASEEINNGKTGYIALNDEDYLEKLKYLMDNPNKLKEMSIECKKMSKNYHIEKIAKDWLKLFNKLDKENSNENNRE